MGAHPLERKHWRGWAENVSRRTLRLALRSTSKTKRKVAWGELVRRWRQS